MGQIYYGRILVDKSVENPDGLSANLRIDPDDFNLYAKFSDGTEINLLQNIVVNPPVLIINNELALISRKEDNGKVRIIIDIKYTNISISETELIPLGFNGYKFFKLDKYVDVCLEGVSTGGTHTFNQLLADGIEENFGTAGGIGQYQMIEDTFSLSSSGSPTGPSLEYITNSMVNLSNGNITYTYTPSAGIQSRRKILIEGSLF